jgi:predicted ATPase
MNIFKHILTRDVAYGSIPHRERSAAHAVVARWLERTTADRAGEFCELLAHHYATAVALGREAGGQVDENLRASAWSWLLRASVDARSRFVVRRAQRLAQEALELSVGDIERCHSLAALGEAYGADSRGDLAWQNLREAALVADASPEISDQHAASTGVSFSMRILTRVVAERWVDTLREIAGRRR